MFKKTEAEPRERQVSIANDGSRAAQDTAAAASVIGRTVVFKGEITAGEDLVIEGMIEGTIAHQSKNLTVGKHGRVKADIQARSVKIEGTVQGDVRCEDLVVLTQTARVTGNIFSPRIHIDDGAAFKGAIDMPGAGAEAAAPRQNAGRPGR